MKTIKQLEKEIEVAKQVKFRNCLVCEKMYSLRKSDTKRYCSRKCSDIAMRVRDWENKRGMDLRIKQATLKQTNEIILIVDKVFKEEFGKNHQKSYLQKQIEQKIEGNYGANN